MKPTALNPKQTTQCAKELVREHGPKAKEVAEQQMQTSMQKGDMKLAGDWLAVMHEIHKVMSYQVN
ncbi:MAG: hypothetical protein U1E36_04240 [Rickettsiales bacterium]